MAGYRQNEFAKSYINIAALRTQTPKTITDRIRELAREDPQKPAFVFRTPGQPRVTLTRQEVVDKAESIGRQLVKLGIKPGDRVATLISTGENWLNVQFGLYMAGAVAVNSPSFDHNTFIDIAKNLTCVGTIEESILNDGESNGKIKSTFFHSLSETSEPANDISLTDLLDKEPQEEYNFPEISPDSEALMACTSGSSGDPKLVVHSHKSIVAGARCFCENLKVFSSDIVTLDRPMVWLGGYPLYYIGSGCAMVYAALTVDPEEGSDFFIDVVEEEISTLVLLMEYRVKALVRLRAKGKKITQLPRCITGGQMLTLETVKEILSLCHGGSTGYGSSEALQLFTFHFNDSTAFSTGATWHRTSGCEIKIVDDGNALVNIGEEGELCIRSPACCKRYMFADGSMKDPFDPEGWYHTGDLCICNPDGMIVLRGRKTEMIKRGTVKIFPLHVEKILESNLDVAEVVVVGIPHPILHQDVCAFIVPKPDTPISEEDVRKRANDIFQPSLSPDGLGYMPGQFFIVDRLPVTKSGKWDKMKLADMALNKLADA